MTDRGLPTLAPSAFCVMMPHDPAFRRAQRGAAKPAIGPVVRRGYAHLIGDGFWG